MEDPRLSESWIYIKKGDKKKRCTKESWTRIDWTIYKDVLRKGQLTARLATPNDTKSRLGARNVEK